MNPRNNASQQWKRYRKEGGTLSFKEWITREKEKARSTAGFDGVQVEVPANKPLTDSIQRALDDIHRKAGYQDHLGGPYLLGIHRTAWIVAGGCLLAGGAYLIYRTRK